MPVGRFPEGQDEEQAQGSGKENFSWVFVEESLDDGSGACEETYDDQERCLEAAGGHAVCLLLLHNVAFSRGRACLPVLALLPSHWTLNAKGRNASVIREVPPL